MMGKDPAFLFYPGDWLGGTMGLTIEQKGAYLELLIYQFNNDKFTKAQAEHMLGTSFVSAWEVLERKFKNEGVFYWNERFAQEVEKRKAFVNSRRSNALGKKEPIKKTKAYAKHKEDRNRDENRIKKEDKILGFEEFWELYDKKLDKSKCIPKWEALNQEDKDAIMEILPIYLKATPDIQFRKNPSTFLNQRTWDNVEGITQQAKSFKKGDGKVRMAGNYVESIRKMGGSSGSVEPTKIGDLIKKI